VAPFLIDVRNVNKKYVLKNTSVLALKKIDFVVEQGEFVAVMGTSGSGKSTLLHILGCLDRPSAGQYLFDGGDIIHASDKDLSHIRANHIGFIFQTFNLLPYLTVYENVALPFHYSGLKNEVRDERVHRSVAKTGLSHRMTHKPSELSGGEMQRVAIARALAIEPKLILADEPTGNLDSATTRQIMKTFQTLHADGATIILVTHDSLVASFAQRTRFMKDGTLV
jgi:putative ABC transport system ATP-binding protein